MAKLNYGVTPTSVILRLKLLNSSVTTGAGLAGLTSASAGLIISTIKIGEATSTAYTQAGATIETITTLGTYEAPTATKCRFKEVDATNHPGLYEIHLADARFASTYSLIVSVSGAADLAQCDIEVQCSTLDANTISQANIDFGAAQKTSLNAATPASVQNIPATGTGLTAIPWNVAWDAEVESECTDALNAYDPPTRTEATTDKDAILADHTVMKQKVAGTYDRESDSLEALRDRGDAAWVTATGFATPTNITAGVITTVTNLTNAPTVGDFNATMKTSLNAATPASVQNIPATGTGLTAIPWNAAWDAEVESEATDALNAYDPPTRAEATTDKDAILADHIVMKQKVAGTYDRETDSLEALRDRGDAAWTTATGFATPTNITAGVITTVTNLTNAPTVGDFNATMKTSLNAATPASVQNINAQTGDSFARLGAPAGASIAADLVVIDNFVDDLETRLSAIRAGYLDNLSAGTAALEGTLTQMKQKVAGTYDRETDSLEALRDRGDAAWITSVNPNVLVDTTIAVVTDQTHFTLTAGSDIDSAYLDQAIVVYDASNSNYPSVRKVSAYAGATKTVTLDSAPGFVIIAGDGVKTFVTAPETTAPTVEQVADGVWDELIAGHAVAGSTAETVSKTGKKVDRNFAFII